jgi:hypothetical protein
MLDHRFAADVGQWLSREPGRTVTGRDYGHNTHRLADLAAIIRCSVVAKISLRNKKTAMRFVGKAHYGIQIYAEHNRVSMRFSTALGQITLASVWSFE